MEKHSDSIQLRAVIGFAFIVFFFLYLLLEQQGTEMPQKMQKTTLGVKVS